LFVGDVDTKELETLNPLYYCPVDVNGGLFGQGEVENVREDTCQLVRECFEYTSS
jgi:hypothetical protein